MEEKVIRPTEVEPRDGYRIWLRYSDGTAGEIDLSHLAGRGVFEAWKNRGFLRDGSHSVARSDRLGRRYRTLPRCSLYAAHRQVR